MSVDVENSLKWHPLTADDALDVADLCEAADYFDDPAQRISFEEIAAQLGAPGSDPERNGVVGRDRAGAALAAGWLFPRGLSEGVPRLWLEWRVHPTARYRGIGNHVVAWLRDRGLEWYDEVHPDRSDRPELWMGCYVDKKLDLRCSQMVANGFAEERYFRDMHVQFDDDSDALIAERAMPEGVSLIAFGERWSEPVRTRHNELFASSHVVSADEWRYSLSVATARPQWSWVAVADDEVIGYAMSSAYEVDWEPTGISEGWIDRIGVAPAWRGRGVAAALVAACLRSYQQAGLGGAGVGVDSQNPQGAERLFERLGFTETDAVVLFGQSFA